jgi:fibronectin type 3 domain-containing protein
MKPRVYNCRMKKLLTLAFFLLTASCSQRLVFGQGPKVTLTWTQSTSAGITGNNVYRGTVSGGPYALLTATPLAPATTYTDTTALSLTTYYYVITALGGTPIVESAYSNQASATVPAHPSPPTGVGAVAQ